MASIVYGACVVPSDDMILGGDITFCQGEYNVVNLLINKSNTIVDCNGTIFSGYKGAPPYFHSAFHTNFYDILSNITIKNCQIRDYSVGLSLEDVNSVAIINNTFFNNSEAIINNFYRYWNNVLIANNTFIDSYAVDIFGTYMHNSSIINNKFISEGIAVRGISISRSYNNTISNNNFTTSTAIEFGSVAINNKIIYNHIVNGNNGIFIQNMSWINQTIQNNTIHDNIICNNTYDINFFTNFTFNYGYNNFCDSTNNWNDAGATGCTYTCTQVSMDSDLDGVFDILDKCPNTPIGEPVDQDGCSNPQFCKKQAICGSSCSLADWKHNEPFSNNPYDCMTMIIAKEGKYQPMCAGSTCAD